MKFPKDHFGRQFQTSWYWKTSLDNMQVRRDWISYSISTDKVFCHHCIIFGRKGQKNWTQDGFCAWSRVINSINLHEILETHIEASLKYKMRPTALPIIPLLEEKNKEKKL